MRKLYSSHVLFEKNLSEKMNEPKIRFIYIII